MLGRKEKMKKNKGFPYKNLNKRVAQSKDKVPKAKDI